MDFKATEIPRIAEVSISREGRCLQRIAKYKRARTTMAKMARVMAIKLYHRVKMNWPGNKKSFSRETRALGWGRVERPEGGENVEKKSTNLHRCDPNWHWYNYKRLHLESHRSYSCRNNYSCPDGNKIWGKGDGPRRCSWPSPRNNRRLTLRVSAVSSKSIRNKKAVCHTEIISECCEISG